MKIKLSDLWRWDGTMDRGSYLLLGAILFALKFNLDRLVSRLFFNRPWSIFDYIRADGLIWRISPGSGDAFYWGTLLVLALPFLWAGVVLTLRRLRSAGLPLWLVVLFVAPFIKLIFFALLCLWPSTDERESASLKSDGLKGWLELVIPKHPAGSAALGIFVTLTLTALTVWLGTTVLRRYGWSLFVGLPFCMGFLPVLFYGYHEPRTWRGCRWVVFYTIALAGLGLLVLAFEGLICIIMAAPLAFAVALVGGVAAYRIQASSWWSHESPRLFCAVILAAPLAMGVEQVKAPEPALLEVTSSVTVDAPAVKVWQHVVAFSELPPPREWLFRLGIAYPVRAEIFGEGPGAVRHCNFSTGPFVEPIEIWDAPHVLKFSVIANPAPMQEWTPYQEVHPPHLDGFLESKGGQFLLTPTANGRTRLTGTTWYQHRMWPEVYWQLWSDAIIHRIHLRVLNHVKQLAETPEPSLDAVIRK